MSLEILHTFDQSDKKTEIQKDNDIVMSGQVHTLVMFNAFLPNWVTVYIVSQSHQALNCVSLLSEGYLAGNGSVPSANPPCNIDDGEDTDFVAV